MWGVMAGTRGSGLKNKVCDICDDLDQTLDPPPPPLKRIPTLNIVPKQVSFQMT